MANKITKSTTSKPKSIKRTRKSLAITKKPEPGQKTKRQIGERNVFSSFLGTTGYGPPPTSTYRLYREMVLNETIALGYSFAKGIMTLPKWNYIAKPKAPRSAVNYITKMMEPIQPYLAETAIASGIKYGWSPHELIWEVINGEPQITKLKHLMHEKTNILVNDDGTFAGLKADLNNEGPMQVDPKEAQGTLLPPGKCFVYSHNREYDNYYGMSLLEQCKNAWNRNRLLTEKQGHYLDKISSVIFMLGYPEGESLNKVGATKDNSDIAAELITAVRQGGSVTYPNTLHPEYTELVRNGITDPKILRSWQFDFLEATTDHGASFVAQLAHTEALMLRGLLVPERSLIEGTSGTKAESETQSNLAMLIAEQRLADFLRQVNWYIIDYALAVRYGQSARGTVEAQAEPMSAEKKTLLKEIVRMLYAPQNADLTLSTLDWDRILEMLNIPKVSTSLKSNIEEILDKDTQPAPQPQFLRENEDNQNQNQKNDNNQQQGEGPEPRTNKQ